MVNFRSPKLLS